MIPETEFQRRVEQIPSLGLGLSVDLYNPNLFDLVQALLDRGLAFGYLEIFKASEAGLREVRQRLPGVSYAMHGEGLWLTQPEFLSQPQTEAELEATIAQLKILPCHWITHECASKQMAGYSFGTYLPPLFTSRAAAVAAEGARFVQHRLDRDIETHERQAPLLLLEPPPWTYFGAGDMEVPAFFRLIAEQAPCGLVLDIGHLWTIYRYSGGWRNDTLREYVARFLEEFPMERVVQIHLAGLALHETVSEPTDQPLWIDAHGAAIPSLVFEMLTQVLASPRLVNLKALAIEVDTKEIGLIVQEFERFQERFGSWKPAIMNRDSTGHRALPSITLQEMISPTPASERALLQAAYRWYAQTAAGVERTGEESFPLARGLDRALLALYQQRYLPHEILHWGGDLRAMFPETCRLLDRAGLPLSQFVSYWFREPRVSDVPYDFFLMKIDRFVRFVQEVLPWGTEVAEQEATDLRVAYHLACEQLGCGSKNE